MKRHSTWRASGAVVALPVLIALAVLAIVAPAPAAAQAVRDDGERLVPLGEPPEAILTDPEIWQGMGDIHAVAVHRRGTVAIAGNDGSLRLWRYALDEGRERTGIRARIVRVGDHPIRAVSFADTGRQLVIAWDDQAGGGQVALWSLRADDTVLSKQPIGTHDSRVHAVAITRDGARVATALGDGTIRLWNQRREAEVAVLTGHVGAVRDIAFDPSGSYLASAGDDGSVRLWRVPGGTQIQLFRGHEGPVHAVAFHSDGTTLASGGEDKTIRKWHAKSSQALEVYRGHDSAVRSVAFARDAAYLASGDDDGVVQIWNVSRNQAVAELRSHRGAVRSIAFHPENRAVLAIGTAAPGPGASEGAASLWNLAPTRPQGGPIRLFGGRIDAVHGVAFHSDGKILASISADNAVRLWQIDSDLSLRVLDTPTSSIAALAFRPERHIIALGLTDNTIRLYNERSGKDIRTLSEHDGPIRDLAYNPSGTILASASKDGTIRLWDMNNTGVNDALRVLPGHRGGVTAVAFGPDGSLLVSGGEDRLVKVWNATSGKLRRTLRGHGDGITCVAFGTRGTLIASGSRDGSVRLWNAGVSRPPRSLRGHTDAITDVAFSPDGRWLISASLDTTIRLWDLTSGDTLETFTMHDHAVRTVAFQPSRAALVLASGSDDGSIRLTELGVEPSVTGFALAPRETTLLRGARAGWLIRKNDRQLGSRLYRHDNGQFLVQQDDDEITSVPPEPGNPPVLQMRRPRFTRTSLDDRAVGSVIVRVANLEDAGPAYWVDIAVVGLPDGIEYVPPSPHLRLDPGKEASLRIDLTGRKPQPSDALRLRIIHAHADARTTTETVYLRVNEVEPTPLQSPVPWTAYAIVASTLAGFLLLGFVYLRIYRNPIVMGVIKRDQTLEEFPLDKLPEVDRVLHRASRRETALTLHGIPAERWSRAVDAARSPAQALQSFAAALGAELTAPIDTQAIDEVAAYEATLPELQVRFAQASAVAAVGGSSLERGRAVALGRAIHRNGAGPEQAIVLDLTADQSAAKQLHDVPRVTCVVLSAEELRDTIFDDRPDQRLEATMVNQLKVADLSPFDIAGGVVQESLFFGRERELRTMGDRNLRSFILVGARQMGKTTLLKALKRRLDERPDVEVHYLTLASENLPYHLQHHLGETVSTDRVSPEEFRELATGTSVPRLWLLDETDRFVEDDARNGCPLTRVMRQLSQDGKAYFVLTGYWHLYEAAVRNRLHPLFNFAEVIRLGPLDSEGAMQLATVPMESLRLNWDSPATRERLVNGTGCRANLIVLACKALIEDLEQDTRLLTGERLERVVDKDPDLGDALRVHDRLDRILVYQAISMPAPSRNAVRTELHSAGLEASRDEYERAFDRLEMSHVLVPDPGRTNQLTMPVPFMRERIERGGELSSRIRDLVSAWNARDRSRSR